MSADVDPLACMSPMELEPWGLCISEGQGWPIAATDVSPNRHLDQVEEGDESGPERDPTPKTISHGFDLSL